MTEHKINYGPAAAAIYAATYGAAFARQTFDRMRAGRGAPKPSDYDDFHEEADCIAAEAADRVQAALAPFTEADDSADKPDADDAYWHVGDPYDFDQGGRRCNTPADARECADRIGPAAVVVYDEYGCDDVRIPCPSSGRWADATDGYMQGEEPEGAPQSKRPWIVEWRCGFWVQGKWTRIDAESKADAVQIARKLYRNHRDEDGLRINVMDGIGLMGGDGVHHNVVLHVGMPDASDSLEIVQYPCVVHGPQQEAYVGSNVPVWRVIGTIKANYPRALEKGVRLPGAVGLLLPLTMWEIKDAISHYRDHSAEIDAQIAAQEG